MTYQPVDDTTPNKNEAASKPPTEPEESKSHTRRNWLPLAIALVIGAGILGWEYRDALYPLLGSPLLFLLVCVGMHFLMHRGHGGHGGGGS